MYIHVYVYIYWITGSDIGYIRITEIHWYSSRHGDVETCWSMYHVVTVSNCKDRLLVIVFYYYFLLPLKKQ